VNTDDNATATFAVTIEGKQVHLEDRDYTGAELRALAGPHSEGQARSRGSRRSETPVPPTQTIRLVAGASLFVSVRFRRG